MICINENWNCQSLPCNRRSTGSRNGGCGFAQFGVALTTHLCLESTSLSGILPDHHKQPSHYYYYTNQSTSVINHKHITHVEQKHITSPSYSSAQNFRARVPVNGCASVNHCMHNTVVRTLAPLCRLQTKLRLG